jgi:hypothetical protein
MRDMVAAVGAKGLFCDVELLVFFVVFQDHRELSFRISWQPRGVSTSHK